MKVIVFFLLCSVYVYAYSQDVYKCNEDGKTVFQSAPCKNGAKVKIDPKPMTEFEIEDLERKKAKLREEIAAKKKADEDEKKRKIEEAKQRLIDEEERKKQAIESEKMEKVREAKVRKAQQDQIAYLRDCAKSACTYNEYFGALYHLSKDQVQSTLDDCQTQVIARSEFLYCNVMLIDGGRRRNSRLQLEIGHIDLPRAIYKEQMRSKWITKINSY